MEDRSLQAGESQAQHASTTDLIREFFDKGWAKALGPAPSVVYCALARFHEGNEPCRVSIGAIQRLTGLSRPWTVSCLQRLVDAGLVVRVRGAGPHGTSATRLAWPLPDPGPAAATRPRGRLVNSVNWLTDLTSQLSELVNSVNQVPANAITTPSGQVGAADWLTELTSPRHTPPSRTLPPRDHINDTTRILMTPDPNKNKTRDHTRATPSASAMSDPSIEGEKTVTKPTSKRRVYEYTPEFEAAYADYPRKVNKRSAFRAWSARLKDKLDDGTPITASMLHEAVRAYAAECRRERREARYIMHPSTFFGPHHRFVDYLPGRGPKAAKPPRKVDRLDPVWQSVFGAPFPTSLEGNHQP